MCLQLIPSRSQPAKQTRLLTTIHSFWLVPRLIWWLSTKGVFVFFRLFFRFCCIFEKLMKIFPMILQWKKALKNWLWINLYLGKMWKCTFGKSDWTKSIWKFALFGAHLYFWVYLNHGHLEYKTACIFVIGLKKVTNYNKPGLMRKTKTKVNNTAEKYLKTI